MYTCCQWVFNERESIEGQTHERRVWRGRIFHCLATRLRYPCHVMQIKDIQLEIAATPLQVLYNPSL